MQSLPIHPTLQKLFGEIEFDSPFQKLYQQLIPKPPEIASGKEIPPSEFFFRLLQVDLENCSIDLLNDEELALRLTCSWKTEMLTKLVQEHILPWPFLSLLLVRRVPHLLPIYFESNYEHFDLIDEKYLAFFFLECNSDYKFRSLAMNKINVFTLPVAWRYLQDSLPTPDALYWVERWIRTVLELRNSTEIQPLAEAIKRVIPALTLGSIDASERIFYAIKAAENNYQLIPRILTAAETLWGQTCYEDETFNQEILKGGSHEQKVKVLRSKKIAKYACHNYRTYSLLKEILMNGSSPGDEQVPGVLTLLGAQYIESIQPLISKADQKTLDWILDHATFPLSSQNSTTATMIVDIALLDPGTAVSVFGKEANCVPAPDHVVSDTFENLFLERICLSQRSDILQKLQEAGFLKVMIDRPLFQVHRGIIRTTSTLDPEILAPTYRFFLEHFEVDPELKIIDSQNLREIELSDDYLTRCLWVLKVIRGGHSVMITEAISVLNSLLDNEGRLEGIFDKLRKPIWLAAIKTKSHVGARLLKETLLSPTVKGKPLAEYAKRHSRMNMYRLLTEKSE